MIRTAIAMIFVALGLVFILPLLVVWTMLCGDPTFMYDTFLEALRISLKIAGIRVCVEGLENIPPGVCIFASNHASNIDPVVLVPQIPPRVSLLAKKSVFRIPILSKAITLAQLIPVDRGDKEAAAESVDAGIALLRGGLSFCVFPEGTRSRDGRLLAFKRGTFVMAIRAGVPVVPVSVGGTQRLMRKGDWRIFPGDVTVRFGPAVSTAGQGIEQRDEVRRKVEKLVADGLPDDQKPLAEAVRQGSEE